MMSGHGANPIFFNKKIKIGRPKHSLTPQPLHPIASHFYLSPRPPPPPVKVYVICVSPLSVKAFSFSKIVVGLQVY